MKQILSEEFQRMQKLAGIINESQLNENIDDKNELAIQIAKDITPEGLYDLVNQSSIKFTYGPDEEGTYYLEFQLELTLDNLESYTPEEFEKELQSAIGGSSYGGPGQSFRKTTVNYDGENNGKHIFSVFQSGGYDI